MLAGEPSTVSGGVATTATATVTVAAREVWSEGGEFSPTAAAAAGIFGEDDKSRVLDRAERAFGGNRWPRQETLALLKIRSDMDVAFRDASVKAPLWEQVSRKLGELGYNRSAKKCKEKFENVFKYHKRTKDGRTSKGQGKAYRFFDQLEAFQPHHPSLHQSPSPSLSPKPQAPAVSFAMPEANPSLPTVPSAAHVTSTTIPAFPSTANPTNLPQQPPPRATNINPTNYPSQSNIPSKLIRDISTDLLSNSTSSSTSSDLELEGGRKRKRKWRDFYERLMKEVVDKQEELQKKFLEAIEKREHERMVREEAWRMQEMTRINREREILAQERSIAAAKDAAVMAFLQKLAEQQNPGSGSAQLIVSNNFPPPILSQATPTPAPAPALVQSQPPPPQPVLSSAAATAPPQPVFSMGTMKKNNGEQPINYMGASSSRWPKVEVEALIKLRTNLDSKYQENGPKGPLWEEISTGMRRLGYNRTAKRCKEKWENINKYFKKVKESCKKRPEDSKTCPYFHQLDVLYKEKHKHDISASNQIFKPENMVPLMVQPEQQWPPQQPEHQQQQDDEAMEDIESDQNVEEDDKDAAADDVEEEENDVVGFETVPNKQRNSMAANE